MIGIGYFIALIFKRENQEDRFFVHDEFCSKEFLQNRLSLLEQIKKKGYPEAHERLDYYEIKSKKLGKKISYFSNAFDDHLLFQYFNKFENRWIAFSNARWMEKIVFIAFMSYGFFLTFSISPYLIIILPFPIIISFLCFGFYALPFQFFQAIFPRKGSFRHATVHFDEMMSAFKIGGRRAKLFPSKGLGYIGIFGAGSSSSGGGSWGGFGGGSSGGGGAGGSW